ARHPLDVGQGRWRQVEIDVAVGHTLAIEVPADDLGGRAPAGSVDRDRGAGRRAPAIGGEPTATGDSHLRHPPTADGGRAAARISSSTLKSSSTSGTWPSLGDTCAYRITPSGSTTYSARSEKPSPSRQTW